MASDDIENNRTRYVGFKCPSDVFEKVLLNRPNKSAVLLSGLKSLEIVDIFVDLFNKIAQIDPELTAKAFERLSNVNQVKIIGIFESYSKKAAK